MERLPGEHKREARAAVCTACAQGTRGPRDARPRVCTRKNPLEIPWGEEVQGGHRAAAGSPELGALGAEARFPGALTRTRGLWSLAPAEVSTSSPGQMTHRAGRKKEEKGKFGQDVRNEPLVRDGEVPSMMKAFRPALAERVLGQALSSHGGTDQAP